MTKYALVPAGGYGCRLKGYMNPLNCKPLIIARSGLTLLEHTLLEIKASGVVEETIIIGREDRESHIRAVANKSLIKYSYVNNGGYKSVRSLLLLCQQIIQREPFFLVCGHAPPRSSHLKQMVNSIHSESDQIITGYRDGERRSVSLVSQDSGLVQKIIPLDSPEYPGLGQSRYYVGSPYLFTPDTIELIRSDNVSHWFGHYFDLQMRLGKHLYSVIANFPKEADTPAELDYTLQYLLESKLAQ
jgi:dTDP-glucose pyrophosphorylase